MLSAGVCSKPVILLLLTFVYFCSHYFCVLDEGGRGALFGPCYIVIGGVPSSFCNHLAED